MLEDSDVQVIGNSVHFTDHAELMWETTVRVEMAEVYMRYVDPDTGGLNTTRLAEGVAEKFQLYSPHGAKPSDFDQCPIPEEVFDWAVEFEESLEYEEEEIGDDEQEAPIAQIAV